MTVPVYIGMPTTDRTFDVPKAAKGIWGNIRCGGPCRDDYARIRVYHQTPARFIQLQRAALDSFKTAEEALGFKIWLTGSLRECSVQTRLYNSDHTRYAVPSSSAHCRGLAIDVSQNMTPKQLKQVHDVLTPRAWHQARSDEPWHYSFGIQV